ncbi:cysteine dioxygenase [Actinoplanes sp. SE50]|uniref:cysteine dioxygenase n=1 Tax=unclassified Actinoplanes TaxID=2626549 RepID=UPI00023EC8AE|nr:MULTISPECIES: cysteine dioxygenase family protein [unclassified Actinoplanes]AEV81471.1 Cysteine dioxygenase type 1 [Actinoplanes sp. SE50/110]ATO79874.1 cysteine dioxygenase [Actinoplanes sp. SE50]SLL97276.1 cysteine dioxygenase [Actinoplanes sp. SE50/110]
MPATAVRLDHLAIARQFANAPEGWVVPPRFDPVERWYHRLEVADDHEVWLLTWLPGQQTELHDHGGSAGAFQVFSGVLTEDTVSGPADAPRVTTRDLGEGAGRRFGSHHVHRIVNRGPDPAISIHVYGPALTSMTKYRLSPAGLETRTVERAGAQW